MICHSEERQRRGICFFVKTYYVYIMASRSRTPYTGVTSNLEKRVFEHKNHLVEGFTKKYRLSRLVYFEETSSIDSAILREKQIKNWRRQKKLDLINATNPSWDDLAEYWFGDQITSLSSRGSDSSSRGAKHICHPEERSDEGSALPNKKQIPRFARNDNQSINTS